MDACMNEDTIRKVCMTDGWMRVIDVKCLKNKHNKKKIGRKERNEEGATATAAAKATSTTTAETITIIIIN